MKPRASNSPKTVVCSAFGCITRSGQSEAAEADRRAVADAQKIRCQDFIEDPNYWHKRAEETRELVAKRVSDNAARKRLAQLATEFNRIALRVEDRINRTKESQ